MQVTDVCIKFANKNNTGVWCRIHCFLKFSRFLFVAHSWNLLEVKRQ
jgi:hypothetical protein